MDNEYWAIYSVETDYSGFPNEYRWDNQGPILGAIDQWSSDHHYGGPNWQQFQVPPLPWDYWDTVDSDTADTAYTLNKKREIKLLEHVHFILLELNNICQNSKTSASNAADKPRLEGAVKKTSKTKAVTKSSKAKKAAISATPPKAKGSAKCKAKKPAKSEDSPFKAANARRFLRNLTRVLLVLHGVSPENANLSVDQLDCTEYVLFFVKTLANFENEFPFLQKSYMTETESWKRRFDSVFEKKNRERIQVVPGTYTSKAQETNDKEWLNVRKSSPYEEEKKDSKSVVPTLSEEDEQELANLVLIPLRRSRKKRFASIMNKSSSYFRLAAPITCETTSPMPTPEEYNA